MATFVHSALKQLTDQQVRFAPPARRAEQLARARKLLEEIEPGRSYPYQFVCYRVTEYRPETRQNLVIPGGDLIHDLGLMIEALVGTVPTEPQQELVTLEQLSQRLNVS